MATNKDELYSDFLIDFDVHPTRKDLVRVVNDEAVKRSIRNLIMTSQMERRFKPRLGGGIRRCLFEHLHPQVALVLKRNIEQTITNHEKRANLINVSVTPNHAEDAYQVVIVFYTINRATPTTLELTLERIR
jgi:phage baseplate assembly protein W